MFDMMKMMGKVKEVQEKMKKAQEELGSVTAEAESGGGLVKVVVNGRKEVVSLQIDPSLINKDDAEMMQDLVIAAVNLAIQSVEVKAREYLKKATEGVMPNIPGLDLNNLM
ncbi:MAG: YbaB/EbfC family nucleoid-associated protein [Cyclobacteriaceae bacterium]|tara:strand:+ start:1198 stop:1530 length:333 start_codon:yes stop_codon:yes gene_type:complete